jgi:hypothetical protein
MDSQVERPSTTSTLHDNGKKDLETEPERLTGSADKERRAEDIPKSDHDDTLIVDWDGPDDVMNPKKCVHTLLLSSFRI